MLPTRSPGKYHKKSIVRSPATTPGKKTGPAPDVASEAASRPFAEFVDPPLSPSGAADASNPFSWGCCFRLAVMRAAAFIFVLVQYCLDCRLAFRNCCFRFLQ